MDNHTLGTIMFSNLSMNETENNTATGSAGGDECENVNHIPGIVSIETSRWLNEFYHNYGRVHGYIAVAVCLFGVMSNSANIIVLTRKNMASSTNTLLLWLAVSDLLTMLSYLPFAIHFYIMEPNDPSRPPFSTREFSWICFLLFHANFSIVCHTIAIWLTIALAIFRYIYICKPIKGAHYCSQQRACFVVVIIFVLTVILCIPNYTTNTYFIFKSTEGGETNVTNSPLNLSNTTASPDMMSTEEQTVQSLYYPGLRRFTVIDEIVLQINNWIHAILIKLVPCFMLTTLTLLLVHAMHKAYRKRMKLKSQGRRAESDKHGEHNRTTGMLLAVVVLFTLTELPQGILTLMNIFVSCFTHLVYYKLGDLLDIMALTNNSVNFVLYCTMSKQFRTTFVAIFCPQKTTQPKWLKLRLIKSQHGNKNSIEVTDKSALNSRRNNNGRSLNTTTVPLEDTSNNQLKNRVVASEPNHEHHSDGIDSHITNDKLPLNPMSSSNGSSTHTHGFSPDHSHV